MMNKGGLAALFSQMQQAMPSQLGGGTPGQPKPMTPAVMPKQSYAPAPGPRDWTDRFAQIFNPGNWGGALRGGTGAFNPGGWGGGAQPSPELPRMPFREGPAPGYQTQLPTEGGTPIDKTRAVFGSGGWVGWGGGGGGGGVPPELSGEMPDFAGQWRPGSPSPRGAETPEEAYKRMLASGAIISMEDYLVPGSFGQGQMQAGGEGWSGMNQNPQMMSTGQPPQMMTRESMSGMSPQDRWSYFQQNPEFYQSMMQGSTDRANLLGQVLGGNYDNITSMLQNMRGW